MNIYAGNLPHAMNDEDLKEAFESFGAVNSAKIVKDKVTGKSKGFGFVEMQNEEDGKQAIAQLHGSNLGGRNVTVSEARPREESPRDNRPFRR
jgi:RNA recognition motif-containing protein